MIYAARGSETGEISGEELRQLISRTLRFLDGKKHITAVTPDITRIHSRGGEISTILYSLLGDRVGAVLPAVGTHVPMTDSEIGRMYPGIPLGLFRAHDWRKDPVELARIPASFVSSVCDGIVKYDYPVQVNRILADGSSDAIISVGQVVPHEITGMSNHAKNLFVGTGGKEAIDKSHFLGAAYGMERIMGRTDTPVRRVFDESLRLAVPQLPPIIWILTVIGRKSSGELVMRGFYSGDDSECFRQAAALSQNVNIQKLETPVERAVVWLDPSEYRSTWLGNKAVHKTRMAIADGGELIILAPGLIHFGEDPRIDGLIRKYGYCPSARMRELVRCNEDLEENLSAAAHLIHGCSEGRFRVIYAPGPGVSRKEIESVGYEYADLNEMLEKYNPDYLKQGWNELDNGGKIFFVQNPALGLWTTKAKFEKEIK